MTALEQRSFALVQSSFVLVQSSFALEQSSFALEQSNFALVQSSFALEQSNFALEQSSFALEQSSFALEQSSFALEQSSFALVRYRTELRQKTAVRFVGNQCIEHWRYWRQMQPLLLRQLLTSSSWVSPRDLKVNFVFENLNSGAICFAQRIRVGRLPKSRQPPSSAKKGTKANFTPISTGFRPSFPTL